MTLKHSPLKPSKKPIICNSSNYLLAHPCSRKQLLPHTEQNPANLQSIPHLKTNLFMLFLGVKTLYLKGRHANKPVTAVSLWKHLSSRVLLLKAKLSLECFTALCLCNKEIRVQPQSWTACRKHTSRDNCTNNTPKALAGFASVTKFITKTQPKRCYMSKIKERSLTSYPSIPSEHLTIQLLKLWRYLGH